MSAGAGQVTERHYLLTGEWSEDWEGPVVGMVADRPAPTNRYKTGTSLVIRSLLIPC